MLHHARLEGQGARDRGVIDAGDRAAGGRFIAHRDCPARSSHAIDRDQRIARGLGDRDGGLAELERAGGGRQRQDRRGRIAEDGALRVGQHQADGPLPGLAQDAFQRHDERLGHLAGAENHRARSRRVLDAGHGRAPAGGIRDRRGARGRVPDHGDDGQAGRLVGQVRRGLELDQDRPGIDDGQHSRVQGPEGCSAGRVARARPTVRLPDGGVFAASVTVKVSMVWLGLKTRIPWVAV